MARLVFPNHASCPKPFRITIDCSLTSLQRACCCAPNAVAYGRLEGSAGGSLTQLRIRQSVSNHPSRDGFVVAKAQDRQITEIFPAKIVIRKLLNLLLHGTIVIIDLSLDPAPAL